MSEELKLRPCPFCGGGGQFEYEMVAIDDHRPRVVCAKCGIDSSPECWNTRPREDALEADNARLRAALESYNDVIDRWHKDLITGEQAALKLFKKMLEAENNKVEIRLKECQGND